MMYILFIVTLGYGVHTTTVELNSEQACQTAAVVYQQKIASAQYSDPSNVLTWCIPQGAKQ